MGKLIDADALKDWLEIVPLTGDGGVDINDLESWIAQQPTANAWISCSERLPEPEGRKQYLITEAHYNPRFKGRHVDVDEYEARDPQNPPYWANHREDDGIRVIAWQPMPEPWKGKE